MVKTCPNTDKETELNILIGITRPFHCLTQETERKRLHTSLSNKYLFDASHAMFCVRYLSYESG